MVTAVLGSAIVRLRDVENHNRIDLMKYELPSTLGSALSFSCCIWLLCSGLPRVLPRHANSRQLRQLRHLAFSDAVAAIGGIGMGCVDLLVPVGEFRTKMCVNWQLSVWTFLVYGITVSALMEAHLVLGFLARAFRWTRLGARVDRTIIAVWLVGAVATSVDASLTKPHYNAINDVCEWASRLHALYGLSTPCMMLAVVTSMVTNLCCYFLLTSSLRPCCCCLHRNVPGSVEARVRQQSCRYIYVALITWVPYMITLSLGEIPGQSWIADFPGMITSFAISLNGTMNFWAYAWHNRHLRQVLEADSPATSSPHLGSEASQSCHHEASYNVGFDGSVHICEVLAPAHSTLSSDEQ